MKTEDDLYRCGLWSQRTRHLPLSHDSVVAPNQPQSSRSPQPWRRIAQNSFLLLFFNFLIKTKKTKGGDKNQPKKPDLNQLIFITLIKTTTLAETSRVLRHVKPRRCGGASTKSRVLSRSRTQTVRALAHDFTD